MAKQKNEKTAKKIKQKLIEIKKRPLNPFSKSCDKISTPKVEFISSLVAERDKTSVNLALISLPTPENYKWKICSILEKKYNSIDHDACRRQLISYPTQTAENLMKNYEYALKIALKKLKANIVCINELGFPSYSLKPWKKAINLTKRLAEEYNSLIIAGSSHDSRTMYNSGHLFYPGCKPSGTHYHKQVSATREHECVNTPAERKTLYTNVFGLRLAILICLDLADYSTVASIVKLQDAIDLLLIPCYSTSFDSFKRIAICASAAMPGMVALVNCYREGELSSYFYSIDKPITKKPDQIKVLLKKPDQIKVLPRNRGEIRLYKIRIKPFRKSKLEQQDRCDDSLKWLFGLEDQKLRSNS